MILPRSDGERRPHPLEGGCTSRGVYQGSTRLSFGVFGRQRNGEGFLDSCGFARLGATGDEG